MNSSFALSYYKCVVLLFFIKRIIEPISGDIINIVTCTVLLKGGKISIPTGRHVDNDFIPGLKTKLIFSGFS
jgi:hypothetical protein